MPHSVTCGACKASFSIPDDVWEKRVQGQIATLKCRQCKASIQVDGRSRKGPSAVVASVVAPVESAATKSPSPAPIATPGGALKQAAPEAPAQQAKPLDTGTRAGVEAPLKKPEIKPSEPQASKSAFDRPKSVVQPSRVEPKRAEPSAAATPKPNISPQVKPKTENRVALGLTSKATTGANATAHVQTATATAHVQSATATAHVQTATATAPARKVVGGIGAKVPIGSAAKPKAVDAPPAVAELKSSPIATKSDENLDELWVVSFSVDDDRELDTAQVLECIAKGQLNDDTIVWKEGMADWLPISQVPQLARAMKPKNTPALLGKETAAQTLPDDGEDETVIYRPGSKAATFMESPKVAPVAGKPETSLGTSAKDKSLGVSARGSATGQPLPESREPSRESLDKPITSALGSKADAAAVKPAGGPPPLRRQPSRPDDSSPLNHPATHTALTKGNDEVVTSVREYTPTASPARAAAPPPLPATEKKDGPTQEGPVTKQAMFPPAATPAMATPGTQPFAPVKASQSLPPTPSFAPRPSDIAALTKIRPKFPKWLPFAVLGGLVLLVAIMAGMSWLRGDNVETKEQKASPDSPMAVGATATKSGTAASIAQTSGPSAEKAASTSASASEGFANSFAQAVAKQRPTGKFDREAAEKALAPAFAKAASCHNKGEPTGTANLTISISPSGQVLSVTIAPPFTTTFTAECIRNALRDASVPAFQGSPGRLAHSIAIH